MNQAKTVQISLPHQPDLKPIKLVYPIWLGQRVSSYEGNFRALRGAIPTFERQPFQVEEGVNPNLDVIVRQPIGFETGPKIPVSVVSRYYDLIQHHEVLDSLQAVFRELQWDADNLKANLTISEFGERIWIKIILPMYVFIPADGYPIELEIHLFNSVDRSCAMEIRLGWQRIICQNGMWVGSYRSFRRIHNLLIPQQRSTVEDFLRGEIDMAHYDRKKFDRWLNFRVHRDQLIQWVNRKVRQTWGVHAAARVFHIAMTGYDGDVKPAFENKAPHELTIVNEFPAPGLSAPVDDAFHLAQVLSWIATRQPSLEKRFEKMQQINELMESLEYSMV